MGLLKGSQVTLDSLVNFSKLQDVLELFLEDLGEHQKQMKSLEDGLSQLREEHEELLGRSRTRTGSLTSAAGDEVEEFHQMMARLSQVDGQFGSGLLARVEKLEDMSPDLEALLLKEKERQMAMMESGEELPDDIRQAIECAMAPLRAAISALEAKIESHLVVRLETHESRLSSHEQVHKDLFTSLDQVFERASRRETASNLEEDERKAAALDLVKQEVSDLSGKLSEVVNSIGDLQMQIPTNQSAASSELTDMMIDASRQLDTRVAALEVKLVSGSTKDLAEMSDSLGQLQKMAKSLEGIVSKDVQPKLNLQGNEMHRLTEELSTLCGRINSMVSKTSDITTSSLPSQCLACAETRRQTSHKVHIGKDGKSYEQHQGVSAKSLGSIPREHISMSAPDILTAASSPWPQDGQKPPIHSRSRAMTMDKVSLQGGAGAPLRKYRIPVGADGHPTWGLVKNHPGSSSSPCLPSATDKGRGLPAPGSRPQSASTVGSRPLDPLLGTLRLLGIGADGDTS